MACKIRWLIIALLIIAGIVSVVIGLGISIYTVEHALSGKITNDTLIYSGKQIEFLMDVSKALIPTVTGFIVILAPAAGYLQRQGYLSSEQMRLWVITVFILAVISLGMWIATLTAMVNCARPFDQLAEYQLSNVNLHSRNLFYFFGVRATELAIIAFFTAIDIAVIIAAFVLGKQD